MLTFISVSFACIINFYVPDISEKIKQSEDIRKIKGFPYQYYKGELLTDEMVNVRIRVIWIYSMVYISITFSLGPMVSPVMGQSLLTSPSVLIERLVPNSFDSQINEQEFVLNMREGENDLSESKIKLEIIHLNNQKFLRRVLILKGGDQTKFGPGARAKADALRNAQSEKSGSGSSIIPGANGFVPQSTYCHYHKSEPSCKTNVKVLDDPFQNDGGDTQPPPENPQFDRTKYKGGPSPFENYDYKDPEVVAQNIGFNEPRRLSKAYDKHAEDCFGMTENRNKQTVENFKSNIQNTAKSAHFVYKGSFRYKDPAFIYLKEINGKVIAVIVHADSGEYISSFSPNNYQIDNLNSDSNIGLDTRPSMELTLKLRGPKNNNL